MLSSVIVDASTTRFIGTLNGAPGASFDIDFFNTNARCDDSGYGEGAIYLGSTSVQTDGAGNASFDVTLQVFSYPGAAMTATATSATGDTSEFSACHDSVEAAPPTPTPTAKATETATPTPSPLPPTDTPTLTPTATATPPSTLPCLTVGQKVGLLVGIIRRLGTHSGNRRYTAHFDVNADGVIDFADFVAVAQGADVCASSCRRRSVRPLVGFGRGDARNRAVDGPSGRGRRRLPAGRLTLVDVVGVLLLSASCGGGQPSRATSTQLQDAPASVADLYDRMTAAMTRPSQVFHSKLSTAWSGDTGHPYHPNGEVWLDLPGQAGRAESVFEDTPLVDRHTIRGNLARGGLVAPTSPNGTTPDVAALSCHDATSAVLSLVLVCETYIEQSTTKLEGLTDFEGARVVSLVSTGSYYGEDQNYTFTDHLYIDASSYLPVALVSEGLYDNGYDNHVRGITRYENDFVSAASLPKDWFGP